MENAHPHILRGQLISKNFGGLQALLDVNFEVTGAQSRSLGLTAGGQRWGARWQGLRAALDAALYRS